MYLALIYVQKIVGSNFDFFFAICFLLHLQLVDSLAATIRLHWKHLFH